MCYPYVYQRRSSRMPHALTGRHHWLKVAAWPRGLGCWLLWDCLLAAGLQRMAPLCPCPQKEKNSRSLCDRQSRCLSCWWLAPVHTECSALLCQACDRGDPSFRCPARKGEGAGGPAQWERGQLERALLWIHGGWAEWNPEWHGWRYFILKV